MRHTVPFWESENVGWKLWFPTDIDIFAKRKPMLMSNRLYMGNLDGYGVSAENPDYGADIQSVDDSFGGGGIGVFEGDVLARPRFSPGADLDHRFNAGQQSDTRYAFEVVTNGPLRSMVRIRTMNWNTGQGRYALEQTYTAYAGQNYTTAQVHFLTWEPGAQGADFAVGVRRRPGQNFEVQEGNRVVTAAPEALRNPDDVEGLQQQAPILYAGTALVVPDEAHGQYQLMEERGGNHVYRIPARADGTYRYMLAAGWSEGDGPEDAAGIRRLRRRQRPQLQQPAAAGRGAGRAEALRPGGYFFLPSSAAISLTIRPALRWAAVIWSRVTPQRFIQYSTA
jgi:hypothetical protein